MKKAISVILCLLMTLSLIACNGSGGGKTSTEASVTSKVPPEENTSNPSTGSESSNDNKTSTDSSVTSKAPSTDTSAESKASSTASTSSPPTETVSSDNSSKPEEETPVDDWRTHPEDYKLIALTFDDAPSYTTTSGNATTTIIDTISKYEGRGTLFVIGQNLDKNGSALLKYAVGKGFELGNHTYSHRSVVTDEIGKTWTAKENFDDFKRCSELIKTAVGTNVKYLRPSGVHTNDAVYRAADDLGLPCISGNCKMAISDWNQATTTEQIVERIFANAFDGAIILLHGNNTATANAVSSVCRILYDDGYRFCTVDELFKFKGIDPKDLPAGKLIYGVDPDTGKVITDMKY